MTNALPSPDTVTKALEQLLQEPEYSIESSVFLADCDWHGRKASIVLTITTEWD